MTDERYGMSLQERVLALENEAAHETEREWNRNMLMGEVAKLARRVDDLERTATETAMKTAATPPAPYRMARPTNRDALVIDDGKVWRPMFGPYGMWESDDDSWVAWEAFTDPEPYQNCILTADDPEPPGGSVVRCDDDSVWQSETGDDWRSMDDVDAYQWTRLLSNRHHVTLLYRGEA